MRMRIVNVVGARPNFMKMAPLLTEYARHPDKFAPVLVHTGQHYDDNMSNLFFEQLRLPKPDVYLGVGSGSHATQTAKIMIEMEKLLTANRPDLVVVVGDVNSTMAAAIVAAKLCIPVAHVEAGLRSFDRTMPEEITFGCSRWPRSRRWRIPWRAHTSKISTRSYASTGRGSSGLLLPRCATTMPPKASRRIAF